MRRRDGMGWACGGRLQTCGLGGVFPSIPWLWGGKRDGMGVQRIHSVAGTAVRCGRDTACLWHLLSSIDIMI